MSPKIKRCTEAGRRPGGNEHTAINQELLAINRALIAINEQRVTALAEIIGDLARDALIVADLALPNDPAEAVLLSGVRQRAEKILAGFGGGHPKH